MPLEGVRLKLLVPRGELVLHLVGGVGHLDHCPVHIVTIFLDI